MEKERTTYSISGQSGGNSARWARASELRFWRFSAGSFSQPVHNVSFWCSRSRDEEQLTEIVGVLAGQYSSCVCEILGRVVGGDSWVFEDGGCCQVGFVDHAEENVVPHILANAGAGGYHGDVVLAKSLFGPDAGYHEQLWRLELRQC